MMDFLEDAAHVAIGVILTAAFIAVIVGMVHEGNAELARKSQVCAQYSANQYAAFCR